jgi:tRNA 2-selenouridine synthase
MKEISPSEWYRLQTEDSVTLLPIDVRSPIEFIEGHIPSALNVPLFTDEERSMIGTIYKQKGQQAAKWKAMEIVSPKIPSLLEETYNQTSQKVKPLFYCWRGGSRSASFATFAELAGLDVYRLQGGYRSFRSWCLEQLNIDLVKDKLPVLLHGMTGVGKTEILHQLSEQHPTLDLEHLANHRGSVFGEIGIAKPHNQKTFDSLLLQRLLELNNADYIILEAESRRIGKVTLPDFLEWRMQGVHFIMQPSLQFRIDMIMQEYVLPFQHSKESRETLATKAQEAFIKIQKRLSPEDRDQAGSALKNEEYAQFIELILVKYYDPRYKFHNSDYSGKFFTITYGSIDEASTLINGHLERLQLKLPVSHI